MGSLFKRRNIAVGQATKISSITFGTVMDTNDPQQMGRLKIMCPGLGDDNNDLNATNLPWASYVSPLGGMVNNKGMTRGPNAGSTSSGPMAYGLWGIPKRGATVLVACVDGDPYYRVWLGALFDQGAANTMPHGRYFYQSNSALPASGTPEGPLNSFEQPIEPLYSNMTMAYGAKSGNFEWRTRGADFSASGNTQQYAQLNPSATSDETTKTTFTAEDGKTFDVQNGYAQNRAAGFESSNESSVYSWTSPGFHGISMDDRPENCRLRIRTTSGTQILLDDTNERIYINNAEGSNWFEMDFDGNIDVFAQTRINLHAESDINLTSDESVRIYGKQGVYITSGADLVEQASGTHSVKGATVMTESTGDLNLKGGGTVLVTGSTLHLNGPDAAGAIGYKLPNRVPQHEPWGRTTTVSDTDQSPLYTYDSPNIGTEDKTRGEYWRR